MMLWRAWPCNIRLFLGLCHYVGEVGPGNDGNDSADYLVTLWQKRNWGNIMVQWDGPIYRDQYRCNAIYVVSAEFGECEQFHTVPVSVWVSMNLMVWSHCMGMRTGTGTGTKMETKHHVQVSTLFQDRDYTIRNSHRGRSLVCLRPNPTWGLGQGLGLVWDNLDWPQKWWFLF